jgi:hypothetical protein
MVMRANAAQAKSKARRRERRVEAVKEAKSGTAFSVRDYYFETGFRMNARIIVSRTNEKPILRGFSVVPWSENCACNEGTALQYPER